MKKRAQRINAHLVGDMRKLVEREAKRRPKRTPVISPTEQLRRFVAGEEQWRVESGVVSEDQYARYVNKMLKQLKERQDAEKLV